MGRSCNSWLLAAGLMLAVASGCGNMGKVDQGRVIAFDKAGKTVTFIRDANPAGKTPEYGLLPPVTYAIPSDPREMGPDPKAGKRMKLDVSAREIVIFDSLGGKFAKIGYTLVDQKDNVMGSDPLVAGKSFPLLDAEKKTVTIYSERQKVLVTFRPPEDSFLLPQDTWAAGDVIRVYYKEPGKALRLMNVTQTDIFKK
jgi:hypothetical protein